MARPPIDVAHDICADRPDYETTEEVRLGGEAHPMTLPARGQSYAVGIVLVGRLARVPSRFVLDALGSCNIDANLKEVCLPAIVVAVK